MRATFHVATLVSRPAQYHAMRASMSAVGYDAPGRCRFTVFDNAAGNRFEPFGVLRQLPADGNEPYVVLCHQDLLFDRATACDVLLARLAALDQRCPRWAVAGTAGIDRRGTPVIHLDDPSGSYRAAGLPRRVDTLDENLLVLRRARPVRPSDGLAGFHFYGADLCLNALLQRSTAHVIDFPVRHLSPGNPDQAPFAQARAAMAQVWRDRLLVGIVSTTCGHLRISRRPAVERLLQHRLVVGLLRRLRLSVVPARHAMSPRFPDAR